MIAKRACRHKIRIRNTCISTQLHVCNNCSAEEVRIRRSRPTRNLAKSQSLVDFDFRGDIPLAYDTGDARSTKTAAYQTGVGRISPVDKCQPNRGNFLTVRRRSNMQAQLSSARCCAKTRWGRAEPGWQRLTAKAYQRAGAASGRYFHDRRVCQPLLHGPKQAQKLRHGPQHTGSYSRGHDTSEARFHVANREPIAPARKRSRVRLDGNTKQPAGGMCLPSPKSRD